jgi:hypothetical protein
VDGAAAAASHSISRTVLHLAIGQRFNACRQCTTIPSQERHYRHEEVPW